MYLYQGIVKKLLFNEWLWLTGTIVTTYYSMQTRF